METLSQTPPLAADIYNTGIYLAVVVLFAGIGQKNFSKQTYLFTLQKIL
jgi:hypothetical protein